MQRTFATLAIASAIIAKKQFPALLLIERALDFAPISPQTQQTRFRFISQFMHLTS